MTGRSRRTPLVARHGAWPRAVLGAGALLGLAACRTWRPASSVGAPAPTPAQVVDAASGPERQPVRLTTGWGAVVILLAPRVERDSVIGAEPRGFPARSGGRRAVALADVARVEAWRFSPSRTAGAVVLGVAAALGALFLFALTQLPYT